MSFFTSHILPETTGPGVKSVFSQSDADFLWNHDSGVWEEMTGNFQNEFPQIETHNTTGLSDSWNSFTQFPKPLELRFPPVPILPAPCSNWEDSRRFWEPQTSCLWHQPRTISKLPFLSHICVSCLPTSFNFMSTSPSTLRTWDVICSPVGRFSMYTY